MTDAQKKKQEEKQKQQEEKKAQAEEKRKQAKEEKRLYQEKVAESRKASIDCLYQIYLGQTVMFPDPLLQLQVMNQLTSKIAEVRAKITRAETLQLGA